MWQYFREISSSSGKHTNTGVNGRLMSEKKIVLVEKNSPGMVVGCCGSTCMVFSDINRHQSESLCVFRVVCLFVTFKGPIFRRKFAQRFLMAH